MSRMITTCANCQSTLAVTAADLRIGQGYVRCGRCDKVFNALLTLTEAEDEPAPDGPESVAHGTRSMPALEEDPLPPLPGGEEEPLPFGSIGDEDEVEVVQTHATGRFRSIVLEGERGTARIEEEDGEEEPERPTGPQPAGEVGHEVSLERVDARREEVARDILRQATSQPIDVLLEEPRDAETAVPEDFDADEAVGNARRASGLWYALAVLLALVLLGQWVHHNRHTLVAVPWLAEPLRSVYGLLGRTVEPSWDLGRYEVRLLGDPEGSEDLHRLTVQAAIAVAPDAGWPQPPPVLRVLLSDRWGNELARADLPPREWALGGVPARLAPGQRVDARLEVAAPERVSGVSVLPCLPDDAGGLHCRE
jgi:predicted Zn finger-like uncharacterized protein